MNNLKTKIGESKSVKSTSAFHLGRLLEVHISEKKHIDLGGKFYNTAAPSNKQKKNFKDNFKYGVLSLKIANKDKSLF